MDILSDYIIDFQFTLPTKKIMRRFIYFVTAVLGMTLSSCSRDDGETAQQAVSTPGEISLTRVEKKMVADGNDFAFSLLHQLDAEAGKSYVFSPMSVGYVLGMLSNGAAGSTQQEIAGVLGFAANSQQTVNNYFANMLLNTPQLDNEVTMEIANALFTNSTYDGAFLNSYMSTLQQYYQAGMESANFTDAAATAARMNSWCQEKTHGMIKDAVDKNAIRSYALGAFLNSTYFSGKWATAFDESKTAEAAFRLSDGNTVMLPVMTKIDTLGYMSDNQVQAVSLPYGKGNYQMVVLMPVKGSTDEMVAQLSAKRFAAICQAMNPQTVEVKLPRYSTSISQSMNSLLQSMGLKVSLSDAADFSNALSEQYHSKNLFSELKHVAHIEIDEAGTKAAAITSLWTYGDAGDNHKPEVRHFHATSPFVYIIYEQTTGAIFFIGKYVGK